VFQRAVRIKDVTNPVSFPSFYCIGAITYLFNLSRGCDFNDVMIVDFSRVDAFEFFDYALPEDDCSV